MNEGNLEAPRQTIFKLEIPSYFIIIMRVKTVNTSLFLVFIATCFDPKRTSSNQILLKTQRRLYDCNSVACYVF
jgi:hypothetical protein